MTPLTALHSRVGEQQQARLRILVVDDQLLYAEAISVLLGQQDGLEVVGIAGDGREGIEQAFALQPDVVLMDIEMPRSTASPPPGGSATTFPDEGSSS